MDTLTVEYCEQLLAQAHELGLASVALMESHDPYGPDDPADLDVAIALGDAAVKLRLAVHKADIPEMNEKLREMGISFEEVS